MPVNSTQRDERLLGLVLPLGRVGRGDGAGARPQRGGCRRECSVGWRVGVVGRPRVVAIRHGAAARRLETGCGGVAVACERKFARVLWRPVSMVWKGVVRVYTALHMRLEAGRRSTTRGNGLRLLLVWVNGCGSVKCAWGFSVDRRFRGPVFYIGPQIR